MTDPGFIPAIAGHSRVFIIEGRAKPDHPPEYESCMRAQAVSKAFGDVTDIECPDPNRPGAYVKVGEFQAGDERATVTLEGRHALDIRSRLLQLASRKCPADVQIHYGDCEDLSNFNLFKKVLFLEDARLMSYETEDLGSLQSGDESQVNESTEISATNLYDIIPLSFAEEADDVVTNRVIDVVICDEISCGQCAEESLGCSKIYAITLAAGGSPGTPPDVVFSVDGGFTWYADDIDTLAATEDPDGVACVCGYLVVISNADRGIHYVDLDELDGTTDPAFVRVTAGLVAGGEPNAIVSVGCTAFVVGDSGYVYRMNDATAGVIVLDAGVATISQLLAVDALSENFFVAVGGSGTILVSEDGLTVAQAPSSPAGVGVAFTSVALRNKNVWLIGTDDGRLFYTLNGGLTWAEKAFPGGGTGEVEDITFATESIVYMSHTTTTTVGRLLASFNGGYDWIVLPQSPGVLPDNDEFSAIAACETDPELLVAVGLEGGGTDGIIVVGRM